MRSRNGAHPARQPRPRSTSPSERPQDRLLAQVKRHLPSRRARETPRARDPYRSCTSRAPPGRDLNSVRRSATSRHARRPCWNLYPPGTSPSGRDRRDDRRRARGVPIAAHVREADASRARWYDGAMVRSCRCVIRRGGDHAVALLRAHIQAIPPGGPAVERRRAAGSRLSRCRQRPNRREGATPLADCRAMLALVDPTSNENDPPRPTRRMDEPTTFASKTDSGVDAARPRFASSTPPHVSARPHSNAQQLPRLSLCAQPR